MSERRSGQGGGLPDRDRATLVLSAPLLFDGTGAPPIEDAALLIDGTRILGVERRNGEWSVPANADVLAWDRGTILPGLVDSHVHLAGLQAVDDDTRSAARAIQQAQNALAAGITTVRDCGGPGMLTIELKAAAAAGAWSGPRLLACGAPLTTTGGHCHWMGGRADSAMELRRRVRQTAEAGGDFVKIMITGGMSTPGSNPFLPQYTVEEVAIAVNDAHRLGMRVAGHVLSGVGIEIAIKAGIDTIEHGWTITGKPQEFTAESAELMAGAGYPVIASVTAHRDLHVLLPDGPEEDVQELRKRLEPHRAVSQLGVPVVVHSDADGSHTRLDRFRFSIEAYRLGMGVSFDAALHAATGLAAEAVGLGGETGSLERGRLADVLVVHGDPRLDADALDEVDLVLLEGREMVRWGRLTIDGSTKPVLDVRSGRVESRRRPTVPARSTPAST